jgi:hypothetical protein
LTLCFVNSCSIEHQLNQRTSQPTSANTFTLQAAEWNPFAEDNFGSLSEEAIIAQQLNQQSRASISGMNPLSQMQEFEVDQKFSCYAS